MDSEDRSKIFSVTEINASIRGLLESQFPFVSVAGEISNLRQPYSGHLYFTLKDERSQIKAVLFKMQQRYLSDIPADGKMVICRGRISAYEPRGDYQLIVDAVDFHGTGALQLQFEKLKKILAEEGLFSEKAKIQPPYFPEHITLVTSPRGAAVHDFLKIARNRCPITRAAVYPVAVQGDHAAGEITEAIRCINASVQTDIIILCRGGGSIEDLQPFNEERVARAIAASTIPVVSAVGHEVDYTIADFAADLRAPTPSAAAEMILPDRELLKSRVRQLGSRMIRIMSANLDRADQGIGLQLYKMSTWRQELDQLLIRIDHMSQNLEHAMVTTLNRKTSMVKYATGKLWRVSPVSRLRYGQQTINELHRRVSVAGRRLIEDSSESLSRAAGVLDAVSPLATLARGYSIARKKTKGQKIVTDYRQVTDDEEIEVSLHRGYLLCRIEKTGKSRFGKEKKETK